MQKISYVGGLWVRLKGCNTSKQQHLANFTKEEKIHEKNAQRIHARRIINSHCDFRSTFGKYGSSAGNSTAKAKAAAIVGNIDVSKTAAALYYYDNNDASDFAAKTTKDVLGDPKYVRNWGDFTAGSIKYESADSNVYPNWHVYVDFTADGKSRDILGFLKNAKGYSGITKSVISVDLITGKVKDKVVAGG